MNLLDRMLGHDRWATAQLLDASREMDDAQLDREFDIGHRTLRSTLSHMIVNIDYWTRMMEQRSTDDMERHDESIADLAEWHKRAHRALASLARRTQEDGRLDNTFTDRFGAEISYGGAIIHVILHNAEHRTEILHILQRLGLSDLPEVDHALWDITVRNPSAAEREPS